ncbi:MAG: TraX family protein [Clostridium sp.]
MNRFTLKIIMIVFMLLDHIGYFIPGMPPVFRYIGRVVSPIFIFLMVEGYFYTKDRGSYLKRLVLGAQIMSIGSVIITVTVPYLISNSNSYIVDYFNVIIAIILSLITTYFTFKTYKAKIISDRNAIKYLFVVAITGICMMNGFERDINPIVNNIFLSMALSFVMLNGLNNVKTEFATTNDMIKIMVALALSVFSEGALMIPAMTYIFYKFKDNNIKLSIAYGVVCLLFLPGLNIEALLKYPQWMMVFSLIFIWLYNGKKGKDIKWIFYIFYPLHIWILFIIGFMVK